MDDWQCDLRKSSRQFLEHVWPVIKAKCGGGEIKPVEVLQDNEIARELDILCGIDVWQTVRGEGARGIASRVQPSKKNWATFTVRRTRFSGAKTEYEKRLEAIKSGGRFIYPYLTCQAYINDEELIGVGLAKTSQLYAVIERELEQGNVLHAKDKKPEHGVWINETHNADFFCVRFSAVADCWAYSPASQAA